MADFEAIADALATRFSAANITPPTGYEDIKLSTANLPGNIVQEPTILILPPEPGGIEFSYTSGTRTGIALFPGRFYIYRVRSTERNSEMLLKWLGSLYDQLSGQVHLGLSSYVTHAVIRGMGVGRFDYGGDTFDGIAWDNEVHIWEALSPTA